VRLETSSSKANLEIEQFERARAITLHIIVVIVIFGQLPLETSFNKPTGAR
jgi:hypothetical protein